jgi:hypothetical protein
VKEGNPSPEMKEERRNCFVAINTHEGVFSTELGEKATGDGRKNHQDFW